MFDCAPKMPLLPVKKKETNYLTWFYIVFIKFYIILVILLSILSVIRHLICGNNLNWLLNLNLIYETRWTGVRSGLLISMPGKLSWFCLTAPITMVLLMWKWVGLFLRKNYLLRCWGWPSILNWIGVLTLSLLLKLLICPCMEYCCHVWAGAPSCYLDLLDKLQKWICSIIGPSLTASLEPLAHCWNVASLSLFYRYYFGRCSSELAQLVPLPFSWGRSIRYSDRLHDFSVTIPRCYKDVYVNSFFPRTAKLWNSLPIEYFPLTYDLSGFQSRINRHLLTAGSF